MSKADRLRAIVEPIVDDLGLELFDLEFAGGTVTITIDLPPGDPRAEASDPDAPRGVDLSDITAVTRAVSRAFDEHDPIEGAYSIEVSSPGLERSLRTPLHFERAVGQTITVKTVPGLEIGRRLKGRLDASDDDGITITLEPGGDQHTIAHRDIEKARTVFEWGPEPKPAKPKPKAGTPNAKPNAKAEQPKQKKVTAP
jgi:ribosome maturation factor RimP